MGVNGNRLEAGTAYSFRRARISGSRSRLAQAPEPIVIFAPEPLVQPRFLAGPADRALTAAEEGELDELRKRFGQGVRVEPQDAQNIVAIPAERASGEPYLFEINFRLGANKKGGQR